MSDRHSLEIVYQIWSDQDGERIEVGPDGDSLGLTEIRHVGSDGKRTTTITFNRSQLEILQQVIGRRLGEIE